MGLARSKFTLHRNGEWSTKANETYYGGSPAGVNKSGEIVKTNCTNLNLARSNASAESFIGVFRDPSASVSSVLNNKSTLLIGCSIVTLQKNSANTNNTSINNDGSPGQSGDDYPYDTSLAWDEGDRLFINASGVWVRTATNAGDCHYGTVVKVGTNYLTVLFYGCPCTNT